MAIHLHSPFPDNHLAGSPRSDSGLGQEFLQAHHQLFSGHRIRVRCPTGNRSPSRRRPGTSTIYTAGRYSAGFVLRRPVTRSPSFHWPRSLSNATRSNRFSTLRLAPSLFEERKLRCRDINLFPCHLAATIPETFLGHTFPWHGRGLIFS